MAGLLYYLLTFTESVGSVFGLRFAYEQPRYAVIQDLSQNVEIRLYEPREAIEATVSGDDRDKAASEAFALLFRYITGANRGEQKIAMTAPVRIAEPMRISMTTPVQTSMSRGQISMRFFLPRAVAKAGAPEPLDSRLHLVQVPEMTVRRYSILWRGNPGHTGSSGRPAARRACQVGVESGRRHPSVQLRPAVHHSLPET